MNAVERAAKVIDTNYRTRMRGVEWGPYPAAQALAAAGLLVTDADRAVLDAAEAVVDHWHHDLGNFPSTTSLSGALWRAVRARREAQ